MYGARSAEVLAWRCNNWPTSETRVVAWPQTLAAHHPWTAEPTALASPACDAGEPTEKNSSTLGQPGMPVAGQKDGTPRLGGGGGGGGGGGDDDDDDEWRDGWADGWMAGGDKNSVR